MGILLEKPTTFGSDIEAGYHRIINFSVDAVNGEVSVQVASFASEAAHDAGASPFFVNNYNVDVDIQTLIVADNVGSSVYNVIKEILENGLLDLEYFDGGQIS